jgi:hypothetical protein
MKKLLLVWNLIMTILLSVVIINGCSGAQYEQLAAQVNENRQLLEEVTALANSNRDAINTNTQAIAANKALIETFATNTEDTINNLQSSLGDYIEQYVEAYVDQVIGGE